MQKKGSLYQQLVVVIEKTIIEITNAINILTRTIRNAALKRGAAIIKALNLMLVIKNPNSNSIRELNSNPGNISLIGCSINYA